MPAGEKENNETLIFSEYLSIFQELLSIISSLNYGLVEQFLMDGDSLLCTDVFLKQVRFPLSPFLQAYDGVKQWSSFARL